MAMTKKDYDLIASAINSALKNDSNIIDVLADVFSTINPRFNGDKFVEACLKDWSPPPKEAELSDIVVGGVYELKFAHPHDLSWLKEAEYVRVDELYPSDPEYPVRVVSIDGEHETDWIHPSQLGARVESE